LPSSAGSARHDLDTNLEYGHYPFVVGDVLKLSLAAALLPAAWRVVGRAKS
jgi:biotin transport system substrate-specific component